MDALWRRPRGKDFERVPSQGVAPGAGIHSACYPRRRIPTEVNAVPIFEYRCASCRHEFETLVRPGDTPACPKCASQELAKLLSLPAIKSDSTHALAMRAAQKRDKIQQTDKAREQREYELSHDD
jgi:putative FmdB family regulatory protein